MTDENECDEKNRIMNKRIIDYMIYSSVNMWKTCEKLIFKFMIFRLENTGGSRSTLKGDNRKL